jgi:signal transduction histidine kinase
MYEVKEPFWQFVDHWQTLIAGGLALFAGVVTVWGTLRAANRQVKTANDAADREIKATTDAANRQITAAQEQTAAAQYQTAVTRELERRRIAREGYAFHAMLAAAMSAVIADVEAARKLPAPTSTGGETREAYVIRQRMKRAGFAELRHAFLHFGGTQTAEFLQLDKQIEDLAAQCSTPINPGSGFPMSSVGRNEGLFEQLDLIEHQARELLDHATGGIKLCREELAKELI